MLMILLWRPSKSNIRTVKAFHSCVSCYKTNKRRPEKDDSGIMKLQCETLERSTIIDVCIFKCILNLCIKHLCL